MMKLCCNDEAEKWGEGMKRFFKYSGIFLCSLLVLFSAAAAELESTVLEVNRMYSLRDEGKFSECIQLADRMLASNAAFMEAYFNKAVSQYQLKDYKGALTTLEEQLKWNPDNELALFNAACMSAFLKQNDKAIGYLRHRMELNTDTKNLMQNEKDLSSLQNTQAFKDMLCPSVRVGGTLLFPDVPAVNLDGRIMVPMRSIFDAMGAEIDWNSSERSVTGKLGGNSVRLTIGSKIATVNGKPYTMDTAPYIEQDRTMIPVRLVGEALGAEVQWNGGTQTADILPKDSTGKISDYSQGPEAITLMTDGWYPEPYYLRGNQGLAMMVLSREQLASLQKLTSSAKKQWMLYWLERYRNIIPDCDPVYIKVVSDGKAYYTGVNWKEKISEVADFTYYHNGLNTNVVKQYRNRFNYLDYGQSNQLPSSLED